MLAIEEKILHLVFAGKIDDSNTDDTETEPEPEYQFFGATPVD